MILALFSHSPSKILYYITDVLLTQTGTFNFFAWYYTQRHQLLDNGDEELFNIEDSVELGSDIEYVIDIHAFKDPKGKHGHKKKRSTLGQSFKGDKETWKSL